MGQFSFGNCFRTRIDYYQKTSFHNIHGILKKGFQYHLTPLPINGQGNAVGESYQMILLITGKQDRNNHI